MRSTLPPLPGLSVEAPASSPSEVPATASSWLPWRRVAWEAAGMWLATRLALLLAGVFTVVLNAHDSRRDQVGVVLGSRSPYDLLASWSRWDAEWYLAIARSGYFSPRSSAFFPLYPLLIHAVAPAAGEPGRLVAALAVSGVGSLAAFVGIALLAASESGPEVAGRAVLAAAAYPLAFFLAAPYTEALFVALAAFTLLCARRGLWWTAAVTAFLAGLTRPTAAILVLPLALEAIRHRPWTGWSHSRLAAAVAAVLAVPAALGCYAGFLWFRFGQPLLFLQVQSIYWHREAHPPWATAVIVGRHLVSNPLLGHWEALLVLDLSMIILFTALTVYGARRQPPAFTAYTAGLLVLCIATPNLSNDNPLSSSARFLAAAVPGFLLLGGLTGGRRGLETLLVTGGFMLQAVLVTLFLSGAWVG